MRKVYLLFLTLSVVFCRVHGQTDIEKEIISDLIAEEFCPVPDESVKNEAGQNKNLTATKQDSIIIILDSHIRLFDTQVDSLEKFQRMGLADLDLSTMNDFFKKNRRSVKISKFQLDNIRIIFLSQVEWDAIMEKGYWKEYHSIYGYIPTINLSRPGINATGNKAFMYYQARSDKLGGAGFFIILEKMDNKWKLKEKVIAWMS